MAGLKVSTEENLVREKDKNVTWAVRPQDTQRLFFVGKHYQQRATAPTTVSQWDFVTLSKQVMTSRVWEKKLFES